MIGKKVSHYRILGELGRGGMGVVYKAEDEKLKRTVALKFLSDRVLALDDDRTRFIHEAQAAAALNHPNICTIYEIDEADGQSFIAMEYVEGKSLRSIIEAGPLKIDNALNIAMQIAEGLGEAHHRQIVHRDIKPANIMITGEGRVKIMDFGLAKSPGGTQLTQEGTTVGTVAYMSPEQGRGEAVDSLTDIWSLGVILYEMVTGRRPFQGDYEQAVIYSIMNEYPEPVTGLRTGVPVELERIIDKCIEKDPAERYQTAADLMADLRHLERIMKEEHSTSRSFVQAHPPSQETAPGDIKKQAAKKAGSRNVKWIPWAAAAVIIALLVIFYLPRYGIGRKGGSGREASGLKMLVVLPFENLGPKTDEYFADGITDAITARLAGLSGLGIISRQSAIQYKDSGKNTRQISEELGVDYILEGTIQRERPSDPASRVRIIPQMIRCSDDIHIWAETYDEDMTEVFQMQSDIAERVARELDIKLLEPERRALASKPTDNIEAYDYYLRGIEYADVRLEEAESIESVKMFEKSVELDPDFAAAWAQLAIARIWMFWRTGDTGMLDSGKAAVDKAMYIDPDLPEGHLALGFYYYYGSRDYEKALEQFYKTLKTRPGYQDAISAVGYIKRRQGKWEEALAIFEQALKLNPRSYVANWDGLANTCLMMRRYGKAEKYIGRAMSLGPRLASSYMSETELAILRDGDREKARSYYKEMIDLAPPRENCLALLTEEFSILRIVYDSMCEAVDLMDHSECQPSSVYESANAGYFRALCSIEHDRDEEAAAILDSARVKIEQDLNEEGLFAAAEYSLLGLIDARLGRASEAISAGKKAVELQPISKDAFDGASFVETLAEIYTITGDHDSAIDQLEILLSVPARVSVKSIRLDPAWDPLRDNPRFIRMLDKYSGRDS